jgi:hypothetical protein
MDNRPATFLSQPLQKAITSSNRNQAAFKALNKASKEEDNTIPQGDEVVR